MRLAACVVAGLVCFVVSDAGRAQAKQPEVAIAATVSGAKIQQVGFRAMIQKLAIRDNLGGYVKNAPDGRVELLLEGPEKRVASVLNAIERGSKKSSSGNVARPTARQPAAGLYSFTIYGWTSVSRGISTPYDLVFHRRADNRKITRKQAQAAWNAIALSTLQGEDLAKFRARAASR